MDETVRWTKALVAVFVCMSMLGGMLVSLPEDVAAAPPEGYIAGNVSNGITPLPGSLVVAIPLFGGVELMTWTDSLGDYVIAAPGGLSYYVLAFNDSCYGSTNYAGVVSGETTYVNFTLEPIAPAVTDVTVMGFVVDEVGNPMTEALIGGFSADPANMGDGPPMYVNMTRTDSAGFFTVDVLPSAAGGGVVAIGIPGYPFTDNSTDEAFVSGHTYWINLTLEPLTYDNDATLSGTVTDQDTGLPLENVMVMVDMWNESSGEGSSNMTWTGPDGMYSMDIKSGWIRVIMTKPGYTMFMQDSIEVLPGEHVVIDASLRASNAIVRGNVTDSSSGLPINMARVFLVDTVTGSMNMAFTNSTGAYTLDAFDGTGLVIGAEADGYGRQFMMLDIAPGDELWIDFQLPPIDASVSGKVTDAITGLPIQGAGVYFRSMAYEEWAKTDGNGDYSMALVSGDYTVEVYAMNYRNEQFDVTISPGPNVVDIEMLPWDIPNTVRMYGYVIDSTSAMGIAWASVEVGTGPPDYTEYNSTMSDSSGYYEMFVAPVELMVVVSAPNYVHQEAYVDASGVSDLRMDFLLDQDLWGPNTTYAQTPKENVSWTNPAWMHGMAQELDARWLGLWQFMKNGSAGGWDYYYSIEALNADLHPLQPSNNNLPYWRMADFYHVDYSWAALPICGWLSDGMSEVYLPYFQVWMGPDMYNGLRGEYVNSSMWGPETGTAWFDVLSGEFVFFTFDNGWYQPATPSDPTGTVTFYVNLIQVQEGTTYWSWRGAVPIGVWSVVGLTFMPDWVAPSGDYASLFYVSDWSGRAAVNFTLYTVDNDPPVADAGPGQTAVVDTVVTLHGDMSYDNVGIVNYRWSFDDGGYVEIYGENVDYSFSTTGNYTITLTVWDGAGHFDTDTTWVEVVDDQSPVADAGPDQEVTVFDVVQFDGTGSWDDVGIVNYTWTIVELTEEMWGPTPQYTFVTPGVYNVSLVVVDTIGQTSSPDTMQVTVRDIDVTPPIADAGVDQTKMGGEEVVLDGSGSWDDVGIVSWTWTFEYEGSPVELYGPVVSFTFWTEGVYIITLNVTDAAGNWDTDEVQITISGMIPEFPTMFLPVTGLLVVVLFAALRRRRVSD